MLLRSLLCTHAHQSDLRSTAPMPIYRIYCMTRFIDGFPREFFILRCRKCLVSSRSVIILRDGLCHSTRNGEYILRAKQSLFLMEYDCRSMMFFLPGLPQNLPNFCLLEVLRRARAYLKRWKC